MPKWPLLRAIWVMVATPGMRSGASIFSNGSRPFKRSWKTSVFPHSAASQSKLGEPLRVALARPWLKFDGSTLRLLDWEYANRTVLPLLQGKETNFFLRSHQIFMMNLSTVNVYSLFIFVSKNLILSGLSI